MYKYKCLNPIAKFGLDHFTREYKEVEELEETDAILVRSAAMHDMDLPQNISAIARAGRCSIQHPRS